MAAAAVYWGAGWPMFYVLNVEPGFWTALPVSFISIGLSFVIVWLCTLAGRAGSVQHSVVAVLNSNPVHRHV
jgi:hypothetical protein